MKADEDDKRTYTVVVNHEEQYSVWFAERELPLGWRAVGKTGTKAECLAHIGEVWTDMRPLSLRKKMAELASEAPPRPAPPEPSHHEPIDDLVKRLGEPQEIEAALRPTRTAKLLKEAIDRGYVHMKFTKTGTELGVRLDRDASDLTGVDFDARTGVVRLVGELVLNYNRVRYHGDLDLASLKGTGRLEFVAAVEPS